MTPEVFKYALVLAYVGLVYWLSWIGMRRTRDMQGFAIGNKDMSPYLIGITLAASISSTATFVINPGFVYVHGKNLGDEEYRIAGYNFAASYDDDGNLVAPGLGGEDSVTGFYGDPRSVALSVAYRF